MIYDNVSNATRYLGISKNLDAALKILAKLNLNALTVGKYIVNDDVFFMVQEYETGTRKEKKFETHSEYIDIQVIVRGDELMGYKNEGSNLEVEIPYTPDIAFYKDPEDYVDVKVKENEFVIFFTNEYHKPGVQLTSKGVQKIVFKVRA